MINLPKLIPISDSNLEKKTILLLSDDIMAPSGIGTMSKEIVYNTVDKFNWIQVAAAINHPEAGKMYDISQQVKEATGVEDCSVILYPYSGYGDSKIINYILDNHRVDGILHFTDPRYWQWLYAMEYDIRAIRKIPLMYYSIWDDLPYPHWNFSAYASCDLLMAINKQTHLIHQRVLQHGNHKVVDMMKESDINKLPTNTTLCSYIPHGINEKTFYPIDQANDDEYTLFLDNFKKLGECNFVVFWNNRNIRRKQPGDVILAFKLFVDKLPEEERSKVCLLMHTHPLDPNGTNLFSVYENIAPNCKIHFSSERVNEKILNYYYNLADVTVNIASNEGFGLSNAESIMAGTPVIANVTGGLQDQMGFLDREGNDWIPTDDTPSNHMGEYKDHGEWAFPVYPSNRSLQGSLETPYIFDDRCLPEDVADRLLQVYKLSRDRRKQIGLIGREWLINKAKMTAGQMGRSIINSITTCINNFTEKPRVELIKIENKKKNIIPGISKRI